jgi:hypothetical protein
MPYTKFVSVYIIQTLISTYDYFVSGLCTSSIFRKLDLLSRYLLRQNGCEVFLGWTPK